MKHLLTGVAMAAALAIAEPHCEKHLGHPASESLDEEEITEALGEGGHVEIDHTPARRRVEPRACAVDNLSSEGSLCGYSRAGFLLVRRGGRRTVTTIPSVRTV